MEWACVKALGHSRLLALLLYFEFAHGFHASLGFAVDLLDLPSGLFLGAIFMYSGSFRSGA